MALEVATALRTAFPDNINYCLMRATALHGEGRTAEARDELLTETLRYPRHPALLYKLACYTCRLGDLTAAARWINELSAIPGAESLKESALDEPDLQPLWVNPPKLPKTD